MTNTKVRFTVEFTSWVDNAKSILSTIVIFEDRQDCVYFGYQFIDNNGNMIGGKSQSITKKIINADELEFSINYAIHSIDNFRVSRKRVFKVIDTTLV